MHSAKLASDSLSFCPEWIWSGALRTLHVWLLRPAVFENIKLLTYICSEQCGRRGCNQLIGLSCEHKLNITVVGKHMAPSNANHAHYSNYDHLGDIMYFGLRWAELFCLISLQLLLLWILYSGQCLLYFCDFAYSHGFVCFSVCLSVTFVIAGRILTKIKKIKKFKNGVCKFRYSLSKYATAKIVHRDLDLLFEGKHFKIFIYPKR